MLRMAPLATGDHLAELISTFYELNSAGIEELDGEPSPLEFMRFVSRNTPFIIRGAASDWEAARTWSADYLLQKFGDQLVNVAVTPFGNADSPVVMDDGLKVLAKPHEERQYFRELLEYLINQEKAESGGEVRYAQTQNDNLRDEYAMLYGDVQRDIPFARIALEKSPDAINMWVGNSKSVTACHKDNYENIYVQVLGRKHFVLLPPICHPCMNEQVLAGATYARSDGELELRLDDNDHSATPFVTWDPDRPSSNSTPYSPLAQPVRVTLDPGDMLYLPAMWYHRVSQSCLEGEGIVVAVNYWYDMDFEGPLYPLCSMVANMSRDKLTPEVKTPK